MLAGLAEPRPGPVPAPALPGVRGVALPVVTGRRAAPVGAGLVGLVGVGVGVGVVVLSAVRGVLMGIAVVPGGRARRGTGR